jgi:hypothetical protein
MRSHGQVTVWGTHAGLGHTRVTASWYQQFKEWWTACKVTRHKARLAALGTRWDAEREALKPFGAEAASEMAATHGAFPTAIRLYGLTL